MTVSFNTAPIQDSVVGEDGKAKKTWIFFFNALSSGDNGTNWTPVSSALDGTYNLTGKYFRNSGFIDFWIIITPITSSTSTGGTTYIELPFDVTISSACFAVYTTNLLAGLVDAATNRVLSPTWTSVTDIITITGRVYTK
jgi:hypothetical protein